MAASGEVFLHIARIKTSVVQGVSIYKVPKRWQQCMLHAFCLLFVCSDEPSEYLFPLVPRYTVSDLPGGQMYTQEEAVLYWESLQNDREVESQPAVKRERKRPNIASYITEVIRDSVKEMPASLRQGVTTNMTSHSLRRGSAAYANASPKLAIQWISTRGAWLLKSLTKAFAYIGTTTREDQSVAKVLTGYEAPDLPVVTPTIEDLQQRLSVVDFGQLVTLRNELFQHVLGSIEPRYNVCEPVVNATFAALLMHMEQVLEDANNVIKPAHVPRYLCELDRGIAATNARLGCRISTATCCEWGRHLGERRRAVNHAQVSCAVTGGDTLLASTLESILCQLTTISDIIGRVECVISTLITGTGDHTESARLESAAVGTSRPLHSTPALATASTLAGCVFNWYTNCIWETVKWEKEQNKRADAKAALNIVQVLYQAPINVPIQPDRSNAEAYQAWKHKLWTLSTKMDRTANERLHAFDGKKPTSKASSLRKRWRQLRSTHLDAYRSLCAQFLALKSNGFIADAYTPPSHQWSAAVLV